MKFNGGLECVILHRTSSADRVAGVIISCSGFGVYRRRYAFVLKQAVVEI